MKITRHQDTNELLPFKSREAVVTSVYIYIYIYLSLRKLKLLPDYIG